MGRTKQMYSKDYLHVLVEYDSMLDVYNIIIRTQYFLESKVNPGGGMKSSVFGTYSGEMHAIWINEGYKIYEVKDLMVEYLKEHLELVPEMGSSKQVFSIHVASAFHWESEIGFAILEKTSPLKGCLTGGTK